MSTAGVTDREKNKRVFKNIASSLLYNIIVAVFGLLIPRLYLVNFGSEVNGLVNTIKQIFGYLVLLEAGVGAASKQALYGPVAKGDRESVCGILSATRQYYRQTGRIYILLTLAFAVIYPLLVKTELGYFTIFAIVCFYALPEILRYFVQGKYRGFLEVEGKAYVLNCIASAGHIASDIFRLAMLFLTDNLLLIQFSYCFPAFLQMGIVVFYMRKHYGWINLNTAPKLSALRQKGAVLIHQVSAVIFANTDTLLISAMCGFKSASVYAVYMLFYNNLDKFLKSFADSVSFRLGQMFSIDKEKFIEFFNIYESLYFMAVFICYTVVAVFLLPVITMYTKGVNDIDYTSPLLIILFTAEFLLNNIKYPSVQIVGISGTFRETRHHAVWEMILNIVFSVALTHFMGIAGCILGTVIALLYRAAAGISFTYKRVLGISVFGVYKKILINTAVFALVLFFIGTKSCAPQGYVYICVRALLNALWIGVLFIGVNFLSDRKSFLRLPDFIRKAVRK